MNSSRNRGVGAYRLDKLHLAVIHGRIRRVRKLLAGDNTKHIIDSRDADGATPLMAAVLTGRHAIARLLLRNGASSEARDRRGRKALDYSRASLMRKKLLIYERLGRPSVSEEQIRKRQRIAKILRYPAALASWSVSAYCSSYLLSSSRLLLGATLLTPNDCLVAGLESTNALWPSSTRTAKS
jgi:hypothetical protein